MKKYKLIKEYPGSPKLGITLRYTGNEWDDQNQIKISLVESSTFLDHWKEIVEKDYEILSFYNKEGKSYYNITTQGYYYSEPASSRSFTYCSLYYQIHSIKRLSDGEIFTIGDKILGFESDKNPFEIISIFHSFDDLCFASYPKNSDLKVGRSCYLSSKYPKKVKQSLFTTEDGVDIFEGDEFYFLQKDWLKIFNNYGKLIAEKNVIAEFAYKRFSTKEKAEEHILMNKKSLSPNDILKVWSDLSGHTTSSLIKNSTLMAAIITHLKNENNKK